MSKELSRARLFHDPAIRFGSTLLIGILIALAGTQAGCGPRRRGGEPDPAPASSKPESPLHVAFYLTESETSQLAPSVGKLAISSDIHLMRVDVQVEGVGQAQIVESPAPNPAPLRPGETREVTLSAILPRTPGSMLRVIVEGVLPSGEILRQVLLHPEPVSGPVPQIRFDAQGKPVRDYRRIRTH